MNIFQKVFAEHRERATSEQDTEQPAKVVTTEEIMYAPVTGKVIPLSEVSDVAFAQGVLGEGVAMEPEIGIFVSPVHGEISMIAQTKHAIGIVTDSGTELLIHIGINTVQLEGKHFKAQVKPGDRVAVGTPIMEVDLAEIAAAGFSLQTPIIVTHAPDAVQVVMLGSGHVAIGDELIKVIQ